MSTFTVQAKLINVDANRTSEESAGVDCISSMIAGACITLERTMRLNYTSDKATNLECILEKAITANYFF